MIEKPRLKAHLSAHTVGKDELFLLGDDRQHLLKSAAAVRLAPLLDGDADVTEIAMTLGSEFPIGEVMGAVSALERGGHLAEGNGVVPAQAAWWEAVDRDATDAAERVAATDSRSRRSAMSRTPPTSPTHCAPPASRFPARSRMDPPTARCRWRRATTPSWCSPRTTSARARRDQPRDARFRPALAAREAGRRDALAGTLVPPRRDRLLGLLCASGSSATATSRPTSSACAGAPGRGVPPRRPPAQRSSPPECSRASSRRSRRRGLRDARRQGRDDAARPRHARAHADQAAAVPGLRRGLRRLRRPRGEALAGAEAAHRRRRLADEDRRGDARGLEKHVSPITGAVAWLSDLSEPGDSGHTFWAGHWFPILGSGARRGRAAPERPRPQRRQGRDPRAGARERDLRVARALQRLFFGDEPRIARTRDEMGERRSISRSSPSTRTASTRSRDEWNRKNTASSRSCPVRLAGIARSTGPRSWSLTNGGTALVPTAYCYYGHPDIADFPTVLLHRRLQRPGRREHARGGDDPGPHGAGRARRGRDLVVQRRCRCPASTSTRSATPGSTGSAREYADIGRDVWALDLTTDVGIPVFAACSRRIDEVDRRT